MCEEERTTKGESQPGACQTGQRDIPGESQPGAGQTGQMYDSIDKSGDNIGDMYKGGVPIREYYKDVGDVSKLVPCENRLSSTSPCGSVGSGLPFTDEKGPSQEKSIEDAERASDKSKPDCECQCARKEVRK